jgi:hypothetical protein
MPGFKPLVVTGRSAIHASKKLFNITPDATSRVNWLSGNKNYSMKKMAVCLLIISIFGCTKQHNRVENSIQGNWELRKLEGGVGGLIVFQPGNGHIYEFNEGSTYRYLNNTTVIETGTYTLQPSPTIGQWTLVLTGPNPATIQVKIADQQLIFLKAADCCDYADITFEKL